MSVAHSRATASVDGQHAPFDVEHAARHLDRLVEVAGDAGHRGQKQIPERVPGQAFAFGEAVAEKVGDERFVVGERDQAVADVAGRQNAELFLQPSRAAAVVADGDDGGEVGGDLLEAAQQRERPVPPPTTTIL